MIRKILFVTLWTAALSICVTFIVVLLSAAYLRVTLHGARPSEQSHQFMVALWTYTPQITIPLALLAGVFGWLPGTRLQATSSSPSEWARWCYRLCAAVALFSLVISIWWDRKVWNVLGIVPMFFALGTALIDKRARNNTRRV
jgi:hypothetical protein